MVEKASDAGATGFLVDAEHFWTGSRLEFSVCGPFETRGTPRILNISGQKADLNFLSPDPLKLDETHGF